SEEHTSELQSRRDLVCRLLLETKERRGSEEHMSELQSRRDLVCRLLLEKNINNCLFRRLFLLLIITIQSKPFKVFISFIFFFKMPGTPGILPLPPPGPFPH